MYFTFTNPSYLMLLFGIPLLFLVHIFSLRNTKRRALKFANFEAISRIKGVEIISKNLTIFIISAAILCLLTLSASGLILHKQAKASSFSFVLALDNSRSMEADDVQPNRLEAAKQVAEDFVNNAPYSTKIGVVSFSGNAFISQEPTTNKELAIQALKSITISQIEGTDFYETLVTSTNLLIKEDAKAIVLISDGQINIGNVQDVISYANKNNVMIHTIAIGTAAGGKTSFGISKMSEDALKAFSYNTQGEFMIASDKAQLEDSFNKVLQITEKNISIELSPYLLLVSIVLFFIEFVLTNTRYKVFP